MLEQNVALKGHEAMVGPKTKKYLFHFGEHLEFELAQNLLQWILAQPKTLKWTVLFQTLRSKVLSSTF